MSANSSLIGSIAENPLQHPLDVVIAIRCFLLCLGRKYRIGHQKDCELHCRVSLEQRVREPKRIV